MSELLAAIAQHACDRPRSLALSGDQRELHYGELLKSVDAYAHALRARGCRVIGLQQDNDVDWVLWDLAAISAGIVSVPLPPFFTRTQCLHAIDAAGIDHLVTSEGLLKIGARTGSRADPKDGPMDRVDSLPPGTTKITFTSGTTGEPKGVCLPQTGLDRIVQTIVDAVAARAPGRHLSVLPLGILLENVAGVSAALMAGHHVILRPLAALGFAQPFRPDYRRLLDVLRRNSINTAILVPEILRGLVSAIEATHVLLPDLRFLAVGGARVSPELIRRARDAGLPVYQGYGLSECGSVVALNTADADRPGSVGRLMPHVDATVRDNEIIIENPIFTGYIGEEHHGPFSTGDLGAIDTDGFIEIQGRARNIIVTSFGRNIAPEWIESVLLDEPDIAQGFVYGDDLPAPCALIVPSSLAADVPAAIARANLRLPAYARIATWHTVPPFTTGNGLLTANGRPRREAIFTAFHHLLTQEYDHGFLRPARR